MSKVTLRLSSFIRMPKTIQRIAGFLFTHSKKTVSCLLGISIVLFGYIIVADRENIFTIKGETESLSVVFSQDQINQWPVFQGVLKLGFEDDQKLITLPLDSFLFPKKDITGRLLLNELDNGKQKLLLTLSSDGDTVGEIETADRVIQLPNYVEITLPIKNSLILPFEGQVLIGEDVGHGVENILLSGSVKIIEQQFFSDQRYVAGDFILDAGDRIELYADKEFTSLSKIKGFVRVSNKSTLSFTVHGEGKGVEINRLGSAGYKIGPSFWARITNDPIVVAVYTLAAMLFLFMEIALLLMQLISQNKKNEEK